MSTNKFRFAIVTLIILVPIFSNIQLDKADANLTNQESTAEIDRRKAQDVFSTPSEEDLRHQTFEDYHSQWLDSSGKNNGRGLYRKGTRRI